MRSATTASRRQRALRILARTSFCSLLLVPPSVAWLIHDSAGFAPQALTLSSLAVMLLSFVSFVVLAIIEERRRRAAGETGAPVLVDTWGAILITSLLLVLTLFMVGVGLGGFVVACGSPTGIGATFILLSLIAGAVAAFATLAVIVRWIASFGQRTPSHPR
jgi:hypothetical protein